MKRPWFKCSPVDETFFEDAPVRLTGRFEIPKPASEVWDELAGANPLHWCSILDGITWTSEAPFGVGSTRKVSALKGLNQFREYFFRWEEGRRKSFYVTEASSPMVKRFAEDYVVEPVGDDACVFTWVIAYEPSAFGKPGDPINRRILGRLFKDTRKYFGAS